MSPTEVGDAEVILVAAISDSRQALSKTAAHAVSQKPDVPVFIRWPSEAHKISVVRCGCKVALLTSRKVKDDFGLPLLPSSNRYLLHAASEQRMTTHSPDTGLPQTATAHGRVVEDVL